MYTNRKSPQLPTKICTTVITGSFRGRPARSTDANKVSKLFLQSCHRLYFLLLLFFRAFPRRLHFGSPFMRLLSLLSPLSASPRSSRSEVKGTETAVLKLIIHRLYEWTSEKRSYNKKKRKKTYETRLTNNASRYNSSHPYDVFERSPNEIQVFRADRKPSPEFTGNPKTPCSPCSLCLRYPKTPKKNCLSEFRPAN